MITRDRAEQVLYQWACGKKTTAQAKAQVKALGFNVDFRQADTGNIMDGSVITTGELVEFVL